jgi:DNA primase
LRQSRDDTKDQVKNATDIVDIIGAYVELKPSGHGRLKALCPFHQEKTPSFTVNSDSQSFFCFGCEKGGDVFTFIQEEVGLSFPEALQLLADKASIQLPEYRGQSKQETSIRKQLVDLGSFALRVYQEQLNQNGQDNAGAHYLATRKLSASTVESFGLGYVPEAWQQIQRLLPPYSRRKRRTQCR